MSKAVENLQAAQQRAMAGRPKAGGFPYLAEMLRSAGVTRNLWSLPSCQSLYLTEQGPVVIQGAPLITGIAAVPQFARDALVTALRTDQAGQSTFPEFLMAAWKAGVKLRRGFHRKNRHLLRIARRELRRVVSGRQAVGRSGEEWKHSVIVSCRGPIFSV